MRILHLFQWKVLDIIPMLKDIKNAGWDAIQITPVQPFKNCGCWWAIYQIESFSIGNTFGSKEDLLKLTEEAHELGLKVIVDVILDHVSSDEKDVLIPNEKVDESLTSNPFFWKEKKQIKDWNSRYEVTNYCYGLPVLNLENYDLQDIVIDFLNELIDDCSVDGFRIDSAKSIKLPSEGSDFWSRVFDNLHNKENLFNYCELIFVDNNIVREYAKYINVMTNFSNQIYDFDNQTKEKLVVFFESHDSFLDNTIGYTSKMNSDTILDNYKYIKNDFKNVIFYSRPFEDKWKIANTI